MTTLSPHISLGIIGCGRATQTLHLPALEKQSTIRVAAVAESDRARLDATADRFRIQRRYADAQELLADPDLDAIAICTPAFSHPELALAAIAAGKHVFVEKPLALSTREGEAMLLAAAGSSKVHALGFNLRCHRLARRAQEIISAGTLGQVHQVVTVWGSPMQHNPQMPEWRRTHASGGGALVEIGAHHIDLCAFLLSDQIARVQMLSRSGSCEDENVSLLAQTRGQVFISSSFSQVTVPVNEVRVIGDRGSLSFSLYHADSLSLSTSSETQEGLRGRWQRLKRWREFPEWIGSARGGGDYQLSYLEEWRRFAAAVLGNGAPASSFADGVAALRVIAAAVRSQDADMGVAVEQEP